MDARDPELPGGRRPDRERPDTGEDDRRGDGEWADLRAAAAGDEAAFERVVRGHRARLQRLCARLLHDPGEAEEAVQEVFLKVYRKADQLAPRGRLYTLLYRVATNHCLNLLRRRRIVRFVPLLAPPPRGGRGGDGGADPAFDPVDPAAEPGDRLVSAERWSAVRAAIERLPPSQRAVLVLVKLEGLSYREAADTLEITVGAVESRLFRAMRRLEKALEDLFAEPPDRKPGR